MSRKKQVAKLVASTLILMSLIAIILISKKQVLLAQKQPVIDLAALRISSNTPHAENNDFGVVMMRNTKAIPHATIEHIALSVPQNEASDKKIIRYGRLVRYQNAQATILICHGFMTDKFDVAFLRHLFPQGKFNFMTFDFRAHGEHCHGQRCTFGRDESLDVTTAAQFLKNHPDLQDKPVIVYGFSMGAVAAIEAQAKNSSLFKAMILDCPFDSTENIIRKGLESIQFTFLGFDFSIPACNLLQKYVFHPYVQSLIKNVLKAVASLDTKNIDTRMYPVTPVQSVQNVRVPCFFIHCKNDEKVSVEAVKSVYANAGTPYKVLWLTNGRRHFDSYFYNPEQYIKEIGRFIEQVVSNSLENKVFENIVEDPDEFLAQI